MTVGYEIDTPTVESRPTNNDAEFPDVDEVVEDDEVIDHAFMDRENIESDDSKDDVVGRSNEDDATCSEDSEERNESADSDDNLLFSDYEEIPIERKHPARFNIED